jgi:hypothetical protein
MKYLKMLGLAAVAAMALMAVVGAGTASATTLEVGGTAKNEAVTIEASLKTGTSALLKDEFGTTTDTCTVSAVKGTTTWVKDENPEIAPTDNKFTGFEVGGPLSALTFEKCTHTTTVLSKGNLWVKWIPTTKKEEEEGKKSTNGTVSSSGAEVTVQSTFFGASAVCKTGAGTTIGTATGVKEGSATIDINASINCGILGSSSWTGTYVTTGAEGKAAIGVVG